VKRKQNEPKQTVSEDLARLGEITRRLEEHGIDVQALLSKKRAQRTRGAGEGSILEPDVSKGRPSFTGMFDMGTSGQGKRLRKKVTGKTREEVADKLAALRKQAEEGLNLSVQITVAQWLAEFCDEQKRTSALTSQTLSKKRWACGHITKHLGTIRLAKLTDRNVTKAYEELAPLLARGSLIHIRSVFVEALNLAEARRLIPVNVARTVKIPTLKNTKPTRDRESLTKREVAELLQWVSTAERGDMWRAALSVQITSGARPGELLALRWGDIDFQFDSADGSLGRATVNITKALARVPRANGERGVDLVVSNTKTKKSRRTVTITEWATGVLSEWRNVQTMRGEDEMGMYVFGSSRIPGQLMEPGTYRKALKRIADEIGIREFSPHELRHSHASLLRDGGLMSVEVANRLGHKDTRMLEQTYERILSDSDVSGLGILEDLWK
jgi:integrase